MRKNSKTSLLVGLSMMAFMINIDYSAVNLALVTIANDVHSSIATIQWILSGYVLAWAAIIIPSGKLADVVGQRTMCIGGLIVFMIASVLAGLAASALMIIAARLLQGVSGAMFVPTLYTLIFSNFPQEKRGFAMGMLCLGVGAGAALGPTFGGVILHNFGWPWIFFINVPITCVAMWMIMTSTSQGDINGSMRSAIHPSAILLSLALLSVMYGIDQLDTLFSSSVSYLLAGLILAAAFAIWQSALSNPIIPLSLFRNRQFVGCKLAFTIEQF
ncbi:MAG: MFS transporter, partial [Coxiellaceae bacterium]|nr:MFS transporter [Coxiellaceae bacterium]